MLNRIKSMIISGLREIAEEDAPPLKKPSIESIDSGFETKDANTFAIALFWGGLCVAAIVVELVLSTGFFAFKRHAMNAQSFTQNPPQDFLEGQAPEKRLHDYRTAEFNRLNSYGWVDHDRKIVHIPIDEAMKKIVEKGNL
jgi:hypothetical protein